MAIFFNAVAEADFPTTDHAWWRKKTADELHESLWSAFCLVDHEDRTRRHAISTHMRLYGRRNIGYTMSDDMPINTGLDAVDGRLRYNLVYSIVETAVSRLGKNRIKPVYVPQGGDWGTYRRTRKLNHYIQGIFDDADVYRWGRQAFRWGCIAGMGGLMFAPRRVEGGWSIGCELVRPQEILVDAVDGMTGQPTSIYRKSWVDRTQLFERIRHHKAWKKKDAKLIRLIEESGPGDLSEVGMNSTHDRVQVVSAWRLPSGPGAGDGRYIIATDKGVLVDDEWDEDWYPIVFFRWQEPLQGFHGNSITEAVTGIQVNINQLLLTLQKAYHLFANPWVAVNRASKILPHQLGNKLGKVVNYEGGVPPQIMAVKPINDQFLTYLQQQKQDGFEISGVSQLSALNRKPPELESGEAFRQFASQEDSRHADPSLNYERFYLDAAATIVGLSARMAKEGRSPRATAVLNRSWGKEVHKIDWDEVAMDRASYKMLLYPTSTLPSTPAGRTATVQEWLRSGLVDRPTAAYLLEIPDTSMDGVANPMLAQYDAVLADIEAMVDGIHGGEPEVRVPEPYQDLRLAEDLVAASYLKLRNMGAPDDVLMRMVNYLDGIDRMKMAAQAEQQMAQMEGMPSGGGAAEQLSQMQGMGVPSMQ